MTLKEEDYQKMLKDLESKSALTEELENEVSHNIIVFFSLTTSVEEMF